MHRPNLLWLDGNWNDDCGLLRRMSYGTVDYRTNTSTTLVFVAETTIG
jgi:hypothetical protein